MSGIVVCYYFFIGHNWWRCNDFVSHCLQVCQGMSAGWLTFWYACLDCSNRTLWTCKWHGFISWFGKEESPWPKCWLTNDPVSVHFLIHTSLCPPRTDQGVRKFSGLFHLRTLTQFMGILISQGPPNSTSRCHHVRDGVSKCMFSFGQGHRQSFYTRCMCSVNWPEVSHMVASFCGPEVP